MEKLNKKHKIILGSGSPRRKELLKMLGFAFDIRVSETDEIAPAHYNGAETAVFIARQKAESLKSALRDDELLITADTEVWLNNKRFGKPRDLEQAKEMLRQLSGKCHSVISGICVCDKHKTEAIAVTTKVFFKPLSESEIEHYINTYKPLDKAGAYGIQEWIGLIGIQKIEGSYFNVVGLPVYELMEVLEKW